MRKRFSFLVLFALILALLLPRAFAAAFPQKPITLIVPYSAGGTADLTARQLAIQLKKHLDVPITVINQAGASGSIGTKTALDAPADGYTLLLSADSLGTQRVMGISEMSYADFRAITPLVNDPKVIVVAGDSGYHTIEQLLVDIASRPGKIKMSYTGPGGSGHVQSLIYNRFGLDMALIAYPGGAEALLAVLGKQVDFTNANFSTIRGYVDSGDLRLLAVSADKRLSAYPGVPALAEVIAGSDALMRIPYTPLSLLVNKNVPEEVFRTLQAATQQALAEPDWLTYCRDNVLDQLFALYQTEEAIQRFYTDWESLVSWLLYDAGAAAHSPAQFDIPRLLINE